MENIIDKLLKMEQQADEEVKTAATKTAQEVKRIEAELIRHLAEIEADIDENIRVINEQAFFKTMQEIAEIERDYAERADTIIATFATHNNTWQSHLTQKILQF